MVSLACPGHCCAVFSISETIDDFARRQLRHTDGEYIYQMLRPLTLDAATEHWAISTGVPPPAWLAQMTEEPEHGLIVTCTHWDSGTRRCRSYENRPAMCRDYPYGQLCAHCGLTADAPTIVAYGAP